MSEIPHPPTNSVWLHVKSGHTYFVWGVAQVEADLSEVVVYQRCTLSTPRALVSTKDGWWTRPLAQFLDGRFTRLEAEGE